MPLIMGLWRNVQYRKSDLSHEGFGLGGLKKWSDMTSAEGDSRLKGQKPEDFLGLWGWIKKVLFWKKRITLEVAGDSDTFFVVGFYDHNLNICKVCTKARQVSEGPFLMRVGPGRIHFFVVAEKEVTLQNGGCFYANTRQPSEIGSLRYDLY
ncbi:hypothetical protein HGA34_05860 [Candidatus Falkowbacteria bacterium]|nr:hypothetical protein [Candidatus Falkowbacteria bacterium]